MYRVSGREMNTLLVSHGDCEMGAFGAVRALVEDSRVGMRMGYPGTGD